MIWLLEMLIFIKISSALQLFSAKKHPSQKNTVLIYEKPILGYCFYYFIGFKCL